MKKKIIEITDGIESIHCCMLGNYNQDIIARIYQIDNLPDYVEEKTADGLTLKEFVQKAKNDCSNVELVDGNILHTGTYNMLGAHVLNIIKGHYKLNSYRIKPNYVHYYTGCNIICKDNQGVPNDIQYSSDYKEVTCPDCIKMMEKSVYVPYTSETAPKFLDVYNIDGWSCFVLNKDSSFYIKDTKQDVSFDTIFKDYKQKDGTPCGTLFKGNN